MSIKPVLSIATPELYFGILLTFGSSIGQTFFISLFAGEIRNEFKLSHGMFGTLYSAATLLSAVVFLWLGKFTDKFDLKILNFITIIALSIFAMLMSSINTLVILFLSIFGLRFFGQSLLSHLAVIYMNRWFSKYRGRALSLSSLGHSVGEALLPMIIVFFLTWFSWREIWVGVSMCMALIFFPIILWIQKYTNSERHDKFKKDSKETNYVSRFSWSRKEVLKDLRFYKLMPGLLASPFIITGVLFHQVHLVEKKSWSLALFASCYPLFAISATGMTLLVGWIVDRFGSVYLLKFYLLPLGFGILIVAITNNSFAVPIFMILMGASSGAATIVISTLWVELYGTEHLGSIRSMCFAILVISTSISPSLIGLLIDIGIAIEIQLVILAVYIFICSISFAVITPKLLQAKSPSSSS